MKRFASPKLAVCAALILGASSSFAGYSVHTTVETVGGKNLYTWTVYNQDQSTGLDAFMMEVPVETQAWLTPSLHRIRMKVASHIGSWGNGTRKLMTRTMAD